MEFMRNKIAFLFVATLACSLVFTHEASAQHKKKGKKTEEAEHKEPWQIDTLINPTPINRQMFTENVEKQIKIADLKDGEADGVVDMEDTMVSRLFTKAMLVDARHVMIHIENLPNTPHQSKIYYHRQLETMLRKLNNRSHTPENAIYVNKMVADFEGLMLAREFNTVHDFVQANANIYTLDNSDMLNDNARHYSYLCHLYQLPQFCSKAQPRPLGSDNCKDRHRIAPATKGFAFFKRNL
jgi:hypothetical protein